MCKSRRVPAVAVGVSSIIVLLLGIAMVILSIIFYVRSFTDMSAMVKYKTSIFVILIVGAVLAILSAILAGVIACKKRHWCCNANVAIFMFISWVLLLTSGIIMGTVSLTNEQTFLTFCDKAVEPKGPFGRVMKNMIVNLDDQIGRHVSENMCSVACPCSATAAAATMSQWTSMTDVELAAYRRAPQMANSENDNRGYKRLFFTDDAQYKTYSTYMDC